MDQSANRNELPAKRGLLLIVGMAAGFLTISGLRELKDIAAPVFFGVNLVLAAGPIGSWVRRKGGPAWAGAVGIGLVVLGFLVAFVYAIYWSIASFVSEMPNYSDEFESLYEQGIARLEKFGVTTNQINDQLRDINPQSIVGVAGGALADLTSVGSLLIVVITVTFFLIMDSAGFDRRLEIASATHPRLVEALTSFSEGVRRYWVVTTIFGLIVAILNIGLLLVLGVPLALVWGVFSFITNYIPNVGFVIGVIPPAMMALLENGPVTALIVLIGFSALNFVIQSLVQPKFTGDAVGVTPTVSFISLLFWAWVLGPLGALLALPATLLVKAVLIDADPQARWVNAFIASDPDSAQASSPREAIMGEDDEGVDDRARDDIGESKIH